MAEKKVGRTPDYDLSALDKDTERRGQIGVGWDNEDGSISIRLNMNVVIDSRTQDLLITLFRRQESHKKRRGRDEDSEEIPY